MLEEIATTVVLGALKKFWDYLKEYFAANNKPAEVDSVASRFIRLFEKHGVHRNQIPRFFGHSLSLVDVNKTEILLAKLTPEILRTACELFAVRLEWLEGVDKQIYDTHDFYKCPEAYAKFLAELVNGRDHQIYAKLMLSTDTFSQEDVLLILNEPIGENGNEQVVRCHLFSNWSTKYWKSRADLTACIAMTVNQPVMMKGNKTSANIEKFCAGEEFIADMDNLPYAYERDWLFRKRFKPWYPDDWLFKPLDYLDGVDEGLFGKISALECWLYHFDKGNLKTRLPIECDRPAFAALLKEYQLAR
jgi:hypothetical protein